jgi:hypothetical protein
MSGSGVAEAHRAAADVMRPSFARLHVAGWSAYALLSFLTLLAYGKGLEFWVVPAATALVGAAGTWAIRPFARRWRGLTLPRQLLATLPLALLVSFLMGLANRLANSVFCDPCGSQSPAPLEYLAAAVTPLYVVMSWLGLYFGITTWRALQAQRQQLLQANALAHEAQLKMLRYQLNPHFLFNTLNAISTLVLDRDTTTAGQPAPGTRRAAALPRHRAHPFRRSAQPVHGYRARVFRCAGAQPAAAAADRKRDQVRDRSPGDRRRAHHHCAPGGRASAAAGAR